MNTTITVTNIPNETDRVFTAAEMKLDKRTREAKSLATWQERLGGLYMIATGYYLTEGSTPTEYTSKFAGFVLKDTAAAVALVEEAKSLGLFRDDKKEIHFSDFFVVDLYTLPEDASTSSGYTVSVLFGQHDSEEYWELRRATENMDKDPFFLTRLADMVACKKQQVEKEARTAAAEAEAEANIPFTRDMETSLHLAKENIARLEQSMTATGAGRARDYKEIAIKAATKAMLEMFVHTCGKITQTQGVYRRYNATEAFGLVISRACNDTFICPTELFGEAVTAFRSDCRAW